MNKITMALIMLFACATSVCAEILDEILVIVNDEVITRRELERELYPIYGQYEASYKGDILKEKKKEAEKKVLDRLVSDKLILSEAKKRNVQVSEGEIDERVNEVRSRFENESEFYMALEEQGISLKELRDNYKSSIMSKALVDMEVGSKIHITPSEIVDFYNKNKDMFVTPESVKVRSIVVKIGQNNRSRESALELIDAIQAKLREGSEFALMAKKFSDGLYADKGGDMGYIKQGDMIGSIDKTIFSLKKGEISDIVETDIGFHIFKVEDIKSSGEIDFDTASNTVERILFKQKMQKSMNEYLDRLKEKAYIEYK